MSESQEALVEHVAREIHEQHSPKLPWEQLHGVLQESDRQIVRSVLDALGLREELRGAYGYVSMRRLVTEWEPTRD